MTTFSAEREPGVSPPAPAVASPAGFLTIERRGLVRLGVAVLLGVTAVVAPLVGPTVGRTGAVFTDQTSSTVTLTTAPTFDAATPSPSPSPSPTGAAPSASLLSPPTSLLPAARLGQGQLSRNPHAPSKTP